MKRLLAICLLFAAVAGAAATNELACARRALADELWTIAESHAIAAASNATSVATRRTARLVQLEALARSERTADMLVHLNTWKDETNETFRYWRAWALAHAGRTNEFATVIAQPFAETALARRAVRLAAWTAHVAGDSAAAEAAFRRASSLLATNPVERAENALDWARIRAANGEVKGARDILRQEGALTVAGPTGDAARLLAAELAQQAGDLAEAGKFCDLLVAGDTNTLTSAFVPAASFQAEQLFRAGRTNDALRVASNAVARAVRPDLQLRAGEVLGFTLLANPETRGAGRSLISGLVNEYPQFAKSAQMQRRLADELLKFHDDAGALKEYETLGKSFPLSASDAHVLEGTGWATLRLGRPAEAAGFFARAAQMLKEGDEKDRCLIKQADALVAAGRYAEAAKVYARVESKDLKERAFFRQADALVRAGQLTEAEKKFRGIFGWNGALAAEAGLRAAALAASVQSYETAIQLYGRLLAEKFAHPLTQEQRVRILSGRGLALYRNYRFAEADADFAAVAKIDPTQAARMEFLRVLCLNAQGRDAEALSRADALLATASDAALVCDLQVWLAQYAAAHRNWSAAVAGFTAAATNLQNSAEARVEALVRAARCANELSDFPQVVDLVSRAATNTVAVKAAEQETAVSVWLAEGLTLQGKALVELGRFDDAQHVLERACRVPAGAKARQRAALAYADCLLAGGADDSNRYVAALDAYNALAREADLSPSLRLTIAFMSARVLEKQHKIPAAMDKYYVDVVEVYYKTTAQVGGHAQYDENARALFARAVFTLADHYESRGDTRAARNMLQKLIDTDAEEQNVARQRIERLRRKGGSR